MRKPPPIKDFRRYPATAVLGALTIGIAVLCFWRREETLRFIIDVRAFHGEPWRLISCVFPHGDFLHLAFNIAWLWGLGTIIESVLGARQLLLMTLLFALVSSAADYAFSQGGIGLSGIVYGYFAFLWGSQRRDERFAGVLDKQTIYLFVGWFFFCIVATRMKWMNIGNVAHGAGAVAGAALVYVPRGRIALAVAAVALIVLGWRYRALVNPLAGEDASYLGYRALQDGNKSDARRWFDEATRIQPKKPDYWYNLAVVEAEVGDPRAGEHFRRAVELDPNDPRFRAGLQWAEQR
jgi:membrane associated rhomboid family serine protease